MYIDGGKDFDRPHYTRRSARKLLEAVEKKRRAISRDAHTYIDNVALPPAM